MASQLHGIEADCGLSYQKIEAITQSVRRHLERARVHVSMHTVFSSSSWTSSYSMLMAARFRWYTESRN